MKTTIIQFHKWDYFLSHLSGDEGKAFLNKLKAGFLSHLSGDEETSMSLIMLSTFLSHLSGDEVLLPLL